MPFAGFMCERDTALSRIVESMTCCLANCEIKKAFEGGLLKAPITSIIKDFKQNLYAEFRM